MAPAGRDLMGGLSKGLKILECFDVDHRRLSIAEAARASGFDRATARRCLLTLAEHGYVTYDGKFFALTPRIMRLGHDWLASFPLATLLQPLLDDLSDRVGQSASAAVLDGTEIIYIARAARKRVMSVTLSPGSRLPAYNSSMGRVLLASLTDKDIRARLRNIDLRAATPFTITDMDRLVAEIRKAGTQGFALIDQELELGLCSIAVPIIDARSRTIAALNIGVSASICSGLQLEERFLSSLIKTQEDVKKLL